MANWSRRVSELVEENKDITDDMFFSSQEYTEFTRQQAEDMISGVCHYLRRQGFHITETMENERLRMFDLDVIFSESDDLTAATDGTHVVINAGSTLLKMFEKHRELRHYAVQGMRVHEIGHVLFTDNPTKRAWLFQLDNGVFWPEAPQRIATPSGVQLAAKMQDNGYCNLLVHYANLLWNSLEDGYVEREMVELYGGLAATELATLNDALISETKGFEEALADPQKHPLLALTSQLLMYAKFDFMNLGNYPEEYRDIIDECVYLIDETKFERDPRKRVKTVNELLCVLYPLVDDFLDEMKKAIEEYEKEQMANQVPSDASSSGGGNSAGNTQPQSANGEDNAEKLRQLVAQAIKQVLTEEAKAAGAISDPRGTTSSIANPNAVENAKAQNRIKADASSGGASNTGSAGSPGGSNGTPDMSAAVFEVNKIVNQRAENIANSKVEGEIEDALNAEAKSFRYYQSNQNAQTGIPVHVERAASVSPANIERYNKLAKGLLVVSRNIERRLSSIIREEENDDTISGLTMGTRLEVRTLYHKDGKHFSRNNHPRDVTRLAVGYLCDESGSMTADALNASIRTGIIVEDLCRRMELPCIIGGFTATGVGALCSFKSYVDPESVDNKDRYRLTGMRASGGTPTSYALGYLANRLNKIPCENKLILVSTDGCSNYGAEVLQTVIKDAAKKGIIVIGAGIGSAREQIQREFGERNYLDIENVETMPLMLCNIIKRYILGCN